MNSDPSKNLLVFRFSSLGDLGLLYPVLVSFLHQNPDYHIILVTRKQFAPLFRGVERLIVFPVDLEKYKGVFGLISLARLLNNSFHFKVVIDAHQVLRTHVLNFILGFFGKKIYTLNKLRKEKSQLVRKENKILKPLPHITDQYRKVFSEAGFEFELAPGPYTPDPLPDDKHKYELTSSPGKISIGLAPFAKWDTKMLPIQKIETLLSLLDKSGKYQTYIFGSSTEFQQVNQWANYGSVHFAEDIGDLHDQIQVMRNLRLMISMDSANMHLAAISGVTNLTIWGSTHRYNGFSPVNSTANNDVEIPVDELSCRPCSIFGDQPCWRGDHACMNSIDINEVFRKIEELTA